MSNRTTIVIRRTIIEEGTRSRADRTRESYSPIFVNGEWKQQKWEPWPRIYGEAYKRSLHGPIREA